MSKGHLLVEETRCKGCGLCVATCQQRLLNLANEHLNARGYHPVEFIDPSSRCTGCALCAVICPEACLTVYRNGRQIARRVPNFS